MEVSRARAGRAEGTQVLECTELENAGRGSSAGRVVIAAGVEEDNDQCEARAGSLPHTLTVSLHLRVSNGGCRIGPASQAGRPATFRL